MERLAALIALLALSGGQEPKTESARALLERAAYVEEHERDFRQAAELYRQAEAAASNAHDPHTAREAAAGRQRAEARRDGTPARPDAAQDAAIDNRVGALLERLAHFNSSIWSNDEQWNAFRALQDDLVVYGAAAAPRLESLLEPRMIDIGDYRVSMDTWMAARLLTTLEVDAASEALGRGLKAKDPLIRRAIAGWLDPIRHRALLEQAARDPVLQVRSLAILRLLMLADPALQPFAEEGARLGEPFACNWLAVHDSQRLLELVEGAEPTSVAKMVGGLGSSQLPLTRENAEWLLKFAREGSDATGRSKALASLTGLFNKNWSKAPREFQLHVQDRLLAEPYAYPADEMDALLGKIGNIRGFEYLARRWGHLPEGGPEMEAKVVAQHSLAALNNLGVEDFAAVARLYREMPESSASWGGQGQWHHEVQRRLQNLARDVSAVTLLDGLNGLEGKKRAMYLYSVGAWLRAQANTQGAIDSTLIPVMREMLDSEDASIKDTATFGLGLAGDFDSLPRLIDLKSGTVRSLVQRDPEKAAMVILPAIQRGEVDAQAILYFQESGRALQFFRECWSRALDEEIQADLLRVLVKSIEGREADAVILEHWQDITKSNSHYVAIERFGRVLYEPAIPILGPALEDPDDNVRLVAREAFRAFKEQREALEEYAAWTLGDREARAQVQDLIELLASPERKVVLGAVKALGAVRGRAALPTLVRLLERKDPELEAEILKAIEAIGH